MFDQVTDRIQGIFKKLRGQPRLRERHVDEALREIRLALLEADVQFNVAKDFVERVRARAVGEEILASLTAPQQVIKVTRDEMVRLLGGSPAALQPSSNFPRVVLMVGLQGSGKTTSSAKLARWLRDNGSHPALVSVDVRRPAALEQLRVLASQLEMPVVEPETLDVVPRAAAAIGEARDRGFDVLVVDTAGRVHVDQALMEELRALEERSKPSDTLFVADSMTGQDAVRSAREFAGFIRLTGHVLTKLDGDARGGAALSIAAVTGVPIKFAAMGEKLDALEPFQPDRMASRILGMGDVLGLIERAERTLEREQAVELARKLRREELTLEDFRSQLRQLRRMGSLSELMSLLPGAGKLSPDLDEKEIVRFEAILDSMTQRERLRPSIVDGSRRRRIALGSGTSVTDVNRLLRRFAEARKLVRKLSRAAGGAPGGGELRRLLGRMPGM
ncbi:MAG TPA: signal recognition particle protein [Vicinamibacteria bacterium]|nr:signal recognition particle protein [Vicinamibacteria bacterium]